MPIGFYDQAQAAQSLSPNQAIYAKIMGLTPPPQDEASTAIGAPVAQTPLDPVEYQRKSILGGQQANYGGTRDLLLREMAGAESPKLESGMPNQYMLGKALVGALLARLFGDKRGTVAAGLLGGVQQGAQMGAETRNKQAQMDFQRQQNILGTEAQIAGYKIQEDAQRRRELLDSAKEDFRMRLEMLKQEGMNERAAMSAALREVSLKLQEVGIQLKARELDEIKKPVAAAGIAKSEAQTKNIEAKTETEDALRPGRVNKLLVDAEKIIQSTAKDAVQTELLRKKVANFDAEFQVRAANIHSMIAKRSQPPSSGGIQMSVNQERLILERLISLNNAQMKKLGMTPSDLVRRAQLQKEVDDATDQLKRLLNPLAPANPLMGPIGKPPQAAPIPKSTPSGAPKYRRNPKTGAMERVG